MNPHILIVDDEPTVGTVLEMGCEEKGWKVTRVGSAERALEVLELQPRFDAFVIDKNLPGMGGVDLLRELRARSTPGAIVMITGFASAESALQTLTLGIDAYIEKPFDDVFEVVNQIGQLIEAQAPAPAVPLAGANRHFQKVVADLQAASHPQSSVGGVLAMIASPPARAWLTGIFEGVGVKVVVTTSATEVRSAAVREQPAVILIDSEIGWDALLGLVPQLRKCAADASFLSFGEEDPPLGVVERMIDVRLRTFVRRTEDGKALVEAVQRELGSSSVSSAVGRG